MHIVSRHPLNALLAIWSEPHANPRLRASHAKVHAICHMSHVPRPSGHSPLALTVLLCALKLHAHCGVLELCNQALIVAIVVALSWRWKATGGLQEICGFGDGGTWAEKWVDGWHLEGKGGLWREGWCVVHVHIHIHQRIIVRVFSDHRRVLLVLILVRAVEGVGWRLRAREWIRRSFTAAEREVWDFGKAMLGEVEVLGIRCIWCHGGVGM